MWAIGKCPRDTLKCISNNVNVLNMEKMYIVVAKVHGRNESHICENVEKTKKKKKHAGFTLAPPSARLTTCGKCVKSLSWVQHPLGDPEHIPAKGTGRTGPGYGDNTPW